MNAYLENRVRQLFSQVYHHLDQQQYTLPYVTGNSINFTSSCMLVYISDTDFSEERIYHDL